MKILLLGEFSGVNINLKQGLQEIGHEVFLAANGDGWKNLKGADKELFSYSKNMSTYEKIKNVLIKPLRCEQLSGYDVVQMISPNIFHYLLLDVPIKRIKNNNEKLFVNGAGLDWFLYKAWKEGKYKKRGFLLENNLETQSIVNGKNFVSICNNYTCKKVIKSADGIIPCVPFEYETPYIGLPNLMPAIMFPINTNVYKYTSNINRGKIVFFHGINRIEDKGTRYIVKAMSKLQKKYPNDVECIVAERMEYSEYVKALECTNVVVDQCRGYGYGMNACISMAKGKVVMGGAEREFLKRANISQEECPVINIKPDEEYIFSKMEEIVQERNCIEEMGYNSRKYIDKYHNYINIAEKYICAWNSINS